MSEDQMRPLAHDPLCRLMERITCRECLDTNIALSLYGPSKCSHCAGTPRMWSIPAFQLQQYVERRLSQSLPVESQNLVIARALTLFSSDAPLTLKQIVDYWRIDMRVAKGVIATLRAEWLLPIGSLRQSPYGAYWITSATEFLEWSRPYRAQAITSLATLYKLQRQHFPNLYGQGELDFVQFIGNELQEALG